MRSQFAPPWSWHNLDAKSPSSARVIHRSAPEVPRNINYNNTRHKRTYSFNNTMTMKHKRNNDKVDPSIILLGSDHGTKRQRTDSVASESSAIENKSYYSNTTANGILNSKVVESGDDNTTQSPRITALVNSFEALENSEQRQIHHQQQRQQHQPPFIYATTLSQAIPLYPTTTSHQVADVMLLQKNNRPSSMGGQPLIARPLIHRIEEHPPIVAQATTENSYKSALQNGVALGHHAPYTNSSSLSFPNIELGPSAAATTKTIAAPFTQYSNKNNIIAHLNHHRTRPSPIQAQTARQSAIHSAVHSDYKKVYKPLKRPPRLPTPHEALIVLVISSAATDTVSSCR